MARCSICGEYVSLSKQRTIANENKFFNICSECAKSITNAQDLIKSEKYEQGKRCVLERVSPDISDRAGTALLNILGEYDAEHDKWASKHKASAIDTALQKKFEKETADPMSNEDLQLEILWQALKEQKDLNYIEREQEKHLRAIKNILLFYLIAGIIAAVLVILMSLK